MKLSHVIWLFPWSNLWEMHGYNSLGSSPSVDQEEWQCTKMWMWWFFIICPKRVVFFGGGEFMFYLLPNFFHYFLKLSFGKIKNKIKTTFLYHGPHDFCSKRASFASLNAKPIKSWQRIMSAWKWTFWGPRAPWSLLHCFLDVNWSWPRTQQPITYFRGARKKFHDPTNVFA